MENRYFLWIADTSSVTLDQKSNLPSADANYFTLIFLSQLLVSAFSSGLCDAGKLY